MRTPILQITLPSGPAFDLILVEGGTFRMGSDHHKSEQPIHQVALSDFYIGKFPVTQALWKAVMNRANPSRFKGDNRPVEQVSWMDTQGFIQKLNETTNKLFRLPTEAEWEYAARGGKYSQGYEYAGSDKLKQVGWYRENSGNETHEVGLLLGNELGIHDLSGNVWEWCEDEWHSTYQGAPDNGSAWIDNANRGVHRVVRGGSYLDIPVYCRTVYRLRYAPDSRAFGFGFRLALSLL